MKEAIEKRIAELEQSLVATTQQLNIATQQANFLTEQVALHKGGILELKQLLTNSNGKEQAFSVPDLVSK